LPTSLPTPEKALSRLPYVLQGAYDLPSLSDWVLGGLAGAVGAAVIGLLGFARRDV
jgi:hypothetical protein